MFYVCFGLWSTPYIRGVKQISDGSDAGQPDFMLFKLQTIYMPRVFMYATVVHISLQCFIFLHVIKMFCFLCILEFKIFWGWRKSSVGVSHDVVASSKDQSLCDIHYVTKIFGYTIYEMWILMNLIVVLFFFTIFILFCFYRSVSTGTLLVSIFA